LHGFQGTAFLALIGNLSQLEVITQDLGDILPAKLFHPIHSIELDPRDIRMSPVESYSEMRKSEVNEGCRNEEKKTLRMRGLAS
jgi:hypothetical protein